MTTQFWLDNPNELVRTIEIWPTEDMTTIEKYNAITRLMLILTTIGFIATKSYQLIVVSICFMASVVYLNHVNKEKKIVDGFETPAALDEIKKNVDTPTEENPYCNVMLDSNVDKKTAPPAYNEETKEVISKNIMNQISKNNENNKDIEKIFNEEGDKKNFDGSLRSFYSTANTEIPNDQAGFTEFCYGKLNRSE